jgi:hypothetical protein
MSTQAVRIYEPKIGSSTSKALKHVQFCIDQLQNGVILEEDDKDYFWNLHANLANRKHHDEAETLCHIYYDMSKDDDATILSKLKYLKDILMDLNERRKLKLAKSKALKRSGISKARLA